MSLKEEVIILLIFDSLINQTPTWKGYNDISWAKIESHRKSHWLSSGKQTRPLIIHFHVGQGATALQKKTLTMSW